MFILVFFCSAVTQGINPENGEAPYRNRLSIQRSKTVNNGRPQESTYLIPENAPAGMPIACSQTIVVGTSILDTYPLCGNI